MADCSFCKIANNEIPCFQLFEDDLVKAFFDINPVSDRRLFVIPKKLCENF